MDANYINTGAQPKVDEFRWFQPTSNFQVEGVKTLPPDYSIPPTPASSYSNLHVVLDSVHPSSETITRGIVLGNNRQYGSRSLQGSLPSSSVSAAPVFTSSPLAPRGLDAYEALEPEMAPIQSSFVPSEQFDDGPSVNIALVDETERSHDQFNQTVGDDIRHKNWNLHQQNNGQWSGLWKNVGNDINSKNWNLKSTRRGLPNNFKLNNSFMLQKLEDAERQWRMERGIDGLWSARMAQVNQELLSVVFPLGWSQWISNLKNKSLNRAADLVEAIVDAAPLEAAKDMAADLSDKATDLAEAVTEKAADLAETVTEKAADLAEAVTEKAADLAETVSDKAASLLDSAKDLASSAVAVKDAAVESFEKMTATPIAKFEKEWDNTNSELYSWSFPRKVPAFILSLEEAERLDRVSRGVNPIVSGMWHQLGREMLHTYKDDLSALFSGLRLQLKKTGSDFVETAYHKLSNFNVAKAPAWTAYSQGPDYFYERVKFDFPRDHSQLDSLEEAERSWRVSRGINPIVSGWWFQVGLELKYKFSLRPTLSSTANQLVRVASDMATKASEFIGDLSSSIVDKSKELLESSTPATVEPEDLHLSVYHFNAEPIDFTFKSSRCPQDIIDLEEKERAERIANGVDVLSYSKWNNLLSAPHKTLEVSLMPESFIAAEELALPVLSAAKETVVESSKGMFGMLNSFAHSVAGTAAHLVDAATHSRLAESANKKYHEMVDTNAEEAERLRLENQKIDPLMAARLGRVQDELLQSTVKSV